MSYKYDCQNCVRKGLSFYCQTCLTDENAKCKPTNFIRANKEMETIEPFKFQSFDTHPDTGKYERIGLSIGKLVDEKNKQYGDSFNKCGEFLKILYPDGVKPEQYSDMLGIARVFDKLMRIANGNQGNENAWRDICGYAILKSEE